MLKDFDKYIDKTIKLPKNIVDLDNFRKSSFKNPKELLEIIKKDKSLQLELSKIIEFNFLNFHQYNRSIINLIKITNLEFITALCTAIKISSAVPNNLFAYAVTKDEFLYSNTFSIYFLNIWLAKFDKKLRSSLLLPSFLKNLSKPIISDAISQNKLIEQFLSEISKTDTNTAEEKFISYKSSRVSANILRNWELSHTIILPIAFFEDLENCPDKFKIEATILNIINSITNPKNPLHSKSIDDSIVTLNNIGFETSYFLETINEIKSSIYNSIN